ncbi:Zinc finger, CCHC-type [Dillenia turbinata]|uniref:Zinc finger, CCHC-type n=1 Tax=Dillenia turbinata TaxID=194707 RepID=A0AAN8V521_9MAGN
MLSGYLGPYQKLLLQIQPAIPALLVLFQAVNPVHMIQFKFRRLEIPPSFNVDHLGHNTIVAKSNANFLLLLSGCIGGCDETLKQLTEICGTGSRNGSGIPGRGRGVATSSGSIHQSITRQSACVHCRQTGHSSNDCPSQASSRSAKSRGINSHGEFVFLSFGVGGGASRSLQRGFASGLKNRFLDLLDEMKASIRRESLKSARRRLEDMVYEEEDSRKGRKLASKDECLSMAFGWLKARKHEDLRLHVIFVEYNALCEQLIQQITGEESSTLVNRRNAISLCMYLKLALWEDSLDNGTAGRVNQHSNVSSSASVSGCRGGGGRSGRGGTRRSDVTFISATGDPMSGRRCFACGDPSHFADVCPNRGN